MKKSVEKIRMAVIRCEAGNLFGDLSSDLIEACEEFLRSQGYKIIEPFNYTYNKIKDIDDLIELFYNLYRKNHPSDLNHHRSDSKIDRNIARQFLEKRMEAEGLPEEHALKECAEIIDALFEFEEEFKFDRTLTFSILGQSKLEWVTEMAIDFLNNRKSLRRIKESEEIQNKLEKLYDSEGDDVIGYTDLDGVLDRLKQNS